MRRANILVFDSGLGGLTVFHATAALLPAANFHYLADDAGFPYGPLSPDALTARVMAVVGHAVRQADPDIVVIACNTASTLVLPPLRAAYPDLPFVGTVPAVKPAAALSRSRMISVLATPGTVTRDYTRDLIATHAADCKVTLVGSPRLAPIAEAFLRREPFDEREVADAIAPCFVADGGRRTDAIVLACTHYPLLHSLFQRHAPWPVTWVDPAPAIARRVVSLLGDLGLASGATSRGARLAAFTSGGNPDIALRNALLSFGLTCETGTPDTLCA